MYVSSRFFFCSPRYGCFQRTLKTAHCNYFMNLIFPLTSLAKRRLAVQQYTFFNLSARLDLWYSVEPRPIYPRGILGTHGIGGWSDPRAGLGVGAECLASIAVRSQDCPACRVAIPTELSLSFSLWYSTFFVPVFTLGVLTAYFHLEVIRTQCIFHRFNSRFGITGLCFDQTQVCAEEFLQRGTEITHTHTHINYFVTVLFLHEFFSCGDSKRFRFMASTYGATRSHSGTPHSVGLIWMSVQSDADIST